jgi:hypothetical protein
LLAVPTAVRRGDEVTENYPSELSDALSVRNYLCDIQEYGDEGWMHEFHEISNTNKHDDIAGHNFKSGLNIGDALFLQVGGTLVIQDGVSLTIRAKQGDFVIWGPQTIKAEDVPAEVSETGVPIKQWEWFDFRIGTGSYPVLFLIETARKFVDKVYSDIQKLI